MPFKSKEIIYICEECLGEFNKKEVYWVLSKLKEFYYVLCKKCLSVRNPKEFKPVYVHKRKKRVKQKQYFKCKKCGNISYRDKKESYTVRQMHCTKCDGYNSLEKIRKPRKK